MGRHRKHATTTNGIAKVQNIADSQKTDKVENRLFKHSVCTECNARNSQRAQHCRKCGCKNLRDAARQYRNG